MANKYCKEYSCDGDKVLAGTGWVWKTDSLGRVYKSYVCDDCAMDIIEMSREDYCGK